MSMLPRIICRVRAIYPFHSEDPASLNFNKGDYIDVLAQLDSGWWDGWCGGARGWFPSNYVEIVNDEEVDEELAAAAIERAHSKVVLNNRRVSRASSAATNVKNGNTPSSPRISTARRESGNSNTTNNNSNRLSRETKRRSTSIRSPTSPLHKHRPYSLSHSTTSSSLGWTASTRNSSMYSEYKLPEGWSVQLAEDGTTRYYYNHRTGKMQYDHPGQPLSDDDDDYESTNGSVDSYSDGDDEDDDDDDQFHSTTSRLSSRLMNRLSLDSLPAAVDTPTTTHSDPDNVMSQWVQRLTPQGRPYYCNLITQETTWDFDDIDKTTGRLRNAPDSDSEVEEAMGQSARRASLLREPADAASGDEESDRESEEPLTWQGISTTIAMAIHHLNTAAQRGDRDVLVDEASAIVISIRMMLYASGTLDKESIHMQDRVLRDPHRAVMASLSKLVLSVKTASEGGHGVHSEVLYRVQRDAGDVLAAVRGFVTVCQEKHIQVEQVKPQLLFDSIEPLQQQQQQQQSQQPPQSDTELSDAEKRASRRISMNGQTFTQKAKYPLNQDLLVSLQTHANQIYGSTDALRKTNDFILENGVGAADECKPRSNIVALFRGLSIQIGQYLSILEDIDLFNMDTSMIPSLAGYRSNKQHLYNAVGTLFSAVQSVSGDGVDITKCTSALESALQFVEVTLADIYLNVQAMVEQRRQWYRKQGARDSMLSPVSVPVVDESDDEEEIGKAPSDAARKLMLQQQQQQQARVPEDRSGGSYLGYDYSSDEIVFGSDGNVKGGTLRALVERLTLHDTFDTSFIATFLLTYRSFCTTEELMTLLEERYNLRPTEDLTPWELEEWTERKQKLVRLRVFNVMKTWLENYYIDEDEFILGRLEFFTNTVIRDASPFSADQLNRFIRMRKEADQSGGLKKLVPNNWMGPLPILPKDITRLTLLDIDPTELSRQLTTMDYKLYSSIRPIECLNKAWSQEDVDNNLAFNVKKSIDYCNRLTCWVTDSILANEEAKKRVVYIKYWAQVATKCRSFNNYNTCMAIISAFDNSAIGRLKKTWELVGNRTNQALGNIRKLMGANRNFQEYREMIHSVNPPCIPFLGIYLQDLTFIEDGNADYIQKSTRLINFAKRQKTAEVIREINQFQSLPYIFQEIPELRAFIKNSLESSRDVDTLYERSIQLEPRETATSTPVA